LEEGGALMKTMTCKQLGGPCDYRLVGDTADAVIKANTLGEWLGIELNHDPATLHFAKSLDVRAWLVNRVIRSHL
jgi:hypothetical protein